MVLAPSPLGHLTASRNGVEVAYSHRAAPIWRALRLPLRFDASEVSTQPRPELLVDLYELLSATQLRALGIEEEG